MTTEPMRAKALWCSGTAQTPWRLHSPMIAVDEAWPTAGTWLASRDRRARLLRVGGQVEVGGDRHQVGVRLRAPRQLEALVELLEVDPALAGGVAQHVGDLLAVVVGDAQQRRVRWPVLDLPHGVRIAR